MPLVLASPLSWVMIGIAALLLWLATYYLIGKPLADLVGNVPVVGRDLRNAIMAGVSAVSNWAFGWANTAVSGVVELLSVPLRAAYEFVQQTTQTVESLVSQVNHVAAVASGQIGYVADRIQSAFAQLAAFGAATAAHAAQIPQLFGSLANLTYNLVPNLIATAVAGVVNFCRTLVGQEAGIRARAIDTQRVATGQAIDGEKNLRIAGDATNAAAAAAAAAALGIRLGQAEAGAKVYTDAKAAEAARSIGALRDVTIPATLAAALAATAAVATQLLQVRTRCVDPLCNAFGPQVDLWNALRTGAELALVMGLVAQAVRDPEGTAGMVASGADALHGLGAGLLSPIIGRSA